MKKKIFLMAFIGILIVPMYAVGVTIKNVDFMNIDNKSRLKIGLDGKTSYDVIRKADKVLLRIDNANIPDHLARPYITKDFVTVIDHILPVRKGSDVVFEITMKQIAPYFVTQDKNTVFMDFDIPEGLKKASVKPEKIQVKAVSAKVEAAKHVVPKAKEIKVLGKEALRPSVMGPTLKPKYGGKRISLDFQNADIHNVLRIIADVSGLNIVTSDDVKGTITIRLKDVPWDQALDVIMESKDLDKMQIGNVVRIAPAGKIKAAQERQLSSKKTKERLEDLVTRVIPVNFAKASDIAKTIQGREVGIVSDRGSITAEDRTNVLIVKDMKKHVDAVCAMVKRLDKATPQVLIESRIVQADEDWVKALGIQWGGAYRNQSSRYHFGLSGSTAGSARNLFNTSGSTSATGAIKPTWSSNIIPSPSMAVNFPTSLGVGAGGAGFGISLGRLGNALSALDLRLDIGETTGSTSVIARPRIITMDNKKAIIKQGEKYPYVVRNQEGELSTELKDIELVLEVTPRVAFDGSVNMEILVKRNAIGAYENPLGDPSIASREVQTEVLVKDGETTVIGGIIENEIKKNVSEVPGIAKVPILGFFFRGKKDEIHKRELLIFITPHVIRPLSLD
ncbi:MAG: type IV pilus secretin PilQ [Thermodesulfobacteriota bacterium]|nr:type IV pilus secretin PilQ [Thermodesulfobacteriota bacterium]